MSKLSQFLGGGGGAVGEIRHFASKKSDGEWLPADGSSYLKSEYPELHELLGGSYTEGARLPFHLLPPIDFTDDPDIASVFRIFSHIDGDFIGIEAEVAAGAGMTLGKKLHIYRNDGGVFTKLTAIGGGATLYTNKTSSVNSFSPSGDYFIWYGNLFSIEGDTFSFEARTPTVNTHFCLNTDEVYYGNLTLAKYNKIEKVFNTVASTTISVSNSVTSIEPMLVKQGQLYIYNITTRTAASGGSAIPDWYNYVTHYIDAATFQGLSSFRSSTASIRDYDALGYMDSSGNSSTYEYHRFYDLEAPPSTSSTPIHNATPDLPRLEVPSARNGVTPPSTLYVSKQGGFFKLGGNYGYVSASLGNFTSVSNINVTIVHLLGIGQVSSIREFSLNGAYAAIVDPGNSKKVSIVSVDLLPSDEFYVPRITASSPNNLPHVKGAG